MTVWCLLAVWLWGCCLTFLILIFLTYTWDAVISFERLLGGLRNTCLLGQYLAQSKHEINSNFLPLPQPQLPHLYFLPSFMPSPVWLFVIPQTVARQAPLSMKFSRQEYWSGLPLFSRASLPPRDQTQVSCIVGRFFNIWATREVLLIYSVTTNTCILSLGIFPDCTLEERRLSTVPWVTLWSNRTATWG